MKQPANVKKLETFLGILTSLARYILNLSQKSANLKNLLKKNSVWYWDKNAENVFTNLKNILVAAPL